MALDTQMVRVDLGMGIDQKTDPKLVLPGRLLTAQNAKFAKTGRLEPRNGWSNAAALPAGGISRLFAFGEQALAISNAQTPGAAPRLNTFDQAAGVFTDVGPVPTVPRCTMKMADTNDQPSFVDCASSTTHTLVAQMVVGAVNVSVTLVMIDNATGRSLGKVTTSTPLSSLTQVVRVFWDSVGSVFVIMIAGTPASTLTTSPSTFPTLTATPALPALNQFTDCVTGQIAGPLTVTFDCAIQSASVSLEVFVPSTGATQALRTISLTTGHQAVFATPRPGVVSQVYLVIYDGSANVFYYLTLNASTLATIAGPTQIANIAPLLFTALDDSYDSTYPLKVIADIASNTTFKFDVSEASSTTVSGDNIQKHYKVTGAGAVTLATTSRGLRLASKLGLSGDGKRAFAWSRRYGSLTNSGPNGTSPAIVASQPTLFLTTFGEASAPTAMIAQGSASVLPGNGLLPQLGSLSATATRAAMVIVAQTLQNTCALVDSDTSPGSGWKSALRDGTSILFSGGYLTQFDGTLMRQCGELLAPDLPIVLPNNAGSESGSKNTGGTYAVTAVYVHVDHAGQRHRSVVGLSQTVTMGGKNCIVVAVSTLRVGVDLSRVSIELYCTTNGGTTFFLEQTIPNDPTVDLLHTVLVLSDAVLSANASIYISGSVSDDVQLDAPTDIVVSPTRALAVSGSRLSALQPSKEMLFGIGPGFYADVVEPIHQSGDEISAISFLAGQTFALKKRSTFAAAGDGPDLTGSGDTFGVFQPFSLEVGILDAASIVTTTFGIVFRSTRGFYMLGRDGGLSYIGADVEDAVSGRTVIDAAFCQDTREVRFLLDGGLLAIVLTFYETKTGIDPKWSTDLYNSPVTAIASTGSSFVAAHTAFGFLTQSPHVGDSFTGTPLFPVVFETGWLSLAGVQGFARWYRMFILGQTLAGFDPTEQIYVDIAYDYVDTYVETRTDTYANATFDGSQLQLEVRTRRHKAQAMKIRVRNGNADTRCTFALSGIAIQAGMRTAPELAAQKRI